MESQREIKTVNIESLKPDPDQPRKEFDEDALKAQGASYLEHGVINPIEVDENMMIITGESRWKAAKSAGLKEVPVIVIKGLSADQKFIRQTCENLARKPLTDKEQVEAFRKIYQSVATSNQADPVEMSLRKIARMIGISHTWAQQLYFLAFEAPNILKEAFAKGVIPFSTLRELKKVKDKETILILGKKAIDEKLRVDDVKTIVNTINQHPDKKEELLRTKYVSGGESVALQINEIVKEEPKPRVISEEEKAIDAQARVVSQFLEYSARILSVIIEAKKTQIGKGNLEIIKKSMADLVDSFNRFTIEKENQMAKQMESVN